ncbi:NAD(P)(+) transhydrogenase (Re/Si-specific) subunit beta [Hirschia maritima]|uniref:NAD(P)(+) transhydrogenase (Re/Si-specific) subunit beta n=1 Tax=Hirschia maritima TaxID=1121961 RepID=UPI00037A8EC6|nr:NAD(P)(+) transhydrogenase (Re/Si-specific) subunit beta [Hirschia maritima]
MSTVDISALLYLVCAVLFIFAIRGLASPETARQGNKIGILGMVLAAGTTLFLVKDNLDGVTFGLITGGVVIGGGIGAVLATRAPMTSMPQMVGMFNALGGMASLLVALAAFYAPASFGLLGAEGTIAPRSLVEMSLSVLIGAITFSGSLIAALKLNGSIPGGPIILPLRHVLNLLIALGIVALIVVTANSNGAQSGGGMLLIWIAILALIFGVTLVIPIGGADMPVVVSMLNSYSGWAAAALGFTLSNFALIVVGAIVGASGAILSYIMCKAMNRSFISVIAGGFGGDDADTAVRADNSDKPVKIGSADDAAFILKNASKVIIVPGYGMAVAQAQHALKEMADSLKEAGVDVSYAIHPVAGRMPGHMNVLLAEAQVPYDEIYEMDDINSSFKQADVAFVIGANDVTNPGAKDDPSSPIYGMPVLEVWNAGTTMFIKRSLASGYAGVQNDLFYRENTMMLLDDAKKMVENIVKAL